MRSNTSAAQIHFSFKIHIWVVCQHKDQRQSRNNDSWPLVTEMKAKEHTDDRGDDEGDEDDDGDNGADYNGDDGNYCDGACDDGCNGCYDSSGGSGC